MRTVRLDVQTLKPNGRYGAEMIAWGDVHLGNPTCNYKKAKAYLEYAVKHGQYILGMGDMIEAIILGSKGDIFRQGITPEDQMEMAIDWLRPVAEAGLLLGLHAGNHEERIQKQTGIRPAYWIAKELGVRYFGDAQFHLFRVGKQTYRVYSVHGRSGAKLPQTKLLACRNLANAATADLYLMGHVHTLETSASIYFDATSKGQKVMKTRHYCITGSFVEYEGSYAETMCLIPSRTGAPKIMFEAVNHDIHISL